MTVFQSIILGVLQGLTEFLPISSSGHLVLAETFWIPNIDVSALQGFDIVLHAGTLLALLIIYWRTWLRLLRSPFTRDGKHQLLLITLIVATVPAALAGFFFEDMISSALRSENAVGLALILTGLVLILGERYNRKSDSVKAPSTLNSFWIGCAQACALVPGLSRSGLTISAGRMVGLSRSEALDFSFLMAVPIIAGATLLTFHDVLTSQVVLPAQQIVISGFIASLVASVLAIRLLRRWVARHSFAWFALYLLPVGAYLVMS